MAKAGDAMLKQASRRRQAALAQQNAAKKMDAEAAILALGADEGGGGGAGGAAGVGGAGAGAGAGAGVNLGQGQTTFHHLQDLQQEHVAPMFEMAWAPMLAVFSLNLETTDGVLCVGGHAAMAAAKEKGSSSGGDRSNDRGSKSAAAREAEEEEENAERVIALCLAGIRNAIRVAARFKVLTSDFSVFYLLKTNSSTTYCIPPHFSTCSATTPSASPRASRWPLCAMRLLRRSPSSRRWTRCAR